MYHLIRSTVHSVLSIVLGGNGGTTVDKHLELLSLYHEQYQRLYRQYVDSQVRWAQWNHWASQQDWYVEWLYENGLKLQDVQSKRPSNKKWERDDGAGAYHHRHLLYHELDQARAQRSKLLKEAWFMLDTNDNFEYSLYDIAVALDSTQNNAQQIIKRHITWYSPRNEYRSRRQHPTNG